MMVRDRLKDKTYFEAYLSKLEFLDERTEAKLANNEIRADRVVPVVMGLIGSLVDRMTAKYSLGVPVIEMLEEYHQAVEWIHDYWPGNKKLTGKRREVLNQYPLGGYDTILWMLSIGYLFDVPDEQFQKLVSVIDQDEVKDKLYEFVIAAKMPSRPKLEQESYKYGFKLFGKLREAVDAEDNAKAKALVKAFLEKDWLKEHKSLDWHVSHKNPHDVYSGNWSFEAAAITCIKGLDDSSYRDQQYYPKDLVNYYRESTSR